MASLVALEKLVVMILIMMIGYTYIFMINNRIGGASVCGNWCRGRISVALR